MCDLSSLNHKFGSAGRALHHSSSTYRSLESNHKTKGRKGAAEIKISVGAARKLPLSCSISPSLVWDLISIPVYGGFEIFISILTTEAQSERCCRPWIVNSPNLNFSPLKSRQLLSYQQQNCDPLRICSFQWEQKSLLHSWMTNTSCCHRTETVRDEDRHCPLHCVSQLLSSVSN